MKILSLKLLLFVLLTLTAHPAFAQSSNLVSVAAVVKGENDDPKDSEQKIAKKHLEIELSASAKISGEVKVTCAFYAESLSSNKVSSLKSTDLKATLESGKRVSLTSTKEIFTYTPEHFQRSGSGKRAKAKKVAATGNRYHGWAVQVFRGSELVGEAYSNRSIMKRFEKE